MLSYVDLTLRIAVKAKQELTAQVWLFATCEEGCHLGSVLRPGNLETVKKEEGKTGKKGGTSEVGGYESWLV